MSINVQTKKVDGFDKELLLIGEGYIARPVTVDKSTISGLVADDKGHYYIPQGTYLYGAEGTCLLANPNQKAIAVVPTVINATATLASAVVVDAKDEGTSSVKVELVVGTAHKIKVAVAGNTITVTLAVDKNGAVKDTWEDVVKAINENIEANSLVVAKLASGADGSALATAVSSTSLSGGDAMAVSSDIDGILYHTVDVTDGEAMGAMIIHGYINEDAMPAVPGAAIKAKLPHIVFGRKD